ncbi:nuclear transport factor 2 family protein [Alcanivorax sp. JB21]|uniref:nuclear transport factor 2 family protein n=1 Tax=Alcanivorax limicola TaxID=2874102 RepID=UPI001CBD67C1|nr:nuclear transport factor 2 family protein [Alcanivorax limicola]MBZ2189273.1 nuclear transport factor 2 family protein [Alcanivorax limicola]
MKHTRFAAVLLCALVLTACSKTPPEEAIEAAIHEMADAVTERRGAVISARLAEDFVLEQYGGQSTMDRRDTQRMMAGLLLRYQDIRVVITNVSVTLDPVRDDQAEATFNALVTGGHGGLLPARGQLFRMSTDWQHDGSDWQVVRASARRALE